MFARDLTASLAAIGCLGALLVVVQAKPERKSAISMKIAPAVQQNKQALQQTQARQPRDVAATPDAEEERVAQAVMAFALSKVSPLRPEPMTSFAPPLTPLAIAPPVRRKTQKVTPPPRQLGSHIPTGLGQAGFRQAKWIAVPSVPRFRATPKDQPVLVALTRLTPKPAQIIDGAQSIAGTARKTVGNSLAGLRGGLASLQEMALIAAGRVR